MALFRFLLEATLPHYFQGHDAYFFVKFNNDERRNSIHWAEEDTILSGVKAKRGKGKNSPREISIKKSDRGGCRRISSCLWRSI